MLDPIFRHFIKPLAPYFKGDIKEVVMNRPQEIWLEHANGEWEKIKDKNLHSEWANSMTRAMAAYSKQKFGRHNPTLSFKIPKFGNKPEEKGGHRVQIFSDATTSNGFAMSIRIYSGKIFTIDDYNISPSDKKRILKAIKEHENIIISAGTGTGKTSFLNMLLRHMDQDERIVTIEGVPELIVPHENHCGLFYSENQTFAGNKGVSELLNDTLRMRPDRILMGELRKENCYIFARAINTGHQGSLSTIHANSPTDAISAMIDNVIINGDAVEGAIHVFEKQLRKRIDGIVQLQRVKNKVEGYFEEIS